MGKIDHSKETADIKKRIEILELKTIVPATKSLISLSRQKKEEKTEETEKTEEIISELKAIQSNTNYPI